MTVIKLLKIVPYEGTLLCVIIAPDQESDELHFHVLDY
jgi:hypothetical protein